jgi:ribonuclease R
MEAERDVVDLYRAVLMRDHVGEEYDGTIAGVAGFGLFVQIESPFVEGLVRAATLSDDHYELDEQTQRLVGQRTGRQFALADPVRVRIENVSVQRRKIDMVLVEHESTAPPPPERPRRRRDDREHKKPLRPAPSRRHDRSARGGNSDGSRRGKRRR